MTVFTHVYRQPMTEATVWAYRETLSDLSAEELDRGCKEAMRQTKFTPTPAEIREYGKSIATAPALNAKALPEPPLRIDELRELWAEGRKKLSYLLDDKAVK